MRMRVLSFYFLVLLFFNSAISWAENCTPVQFQTENNDIILNNTDTKVPQIYFFNNKSAVSVFIDHSNPNPGASAGWATYLRPGNWSVLVLNKKNFKMHCVKIEQGEVVILNCADTLNICTPDNLLMANKLKGNFWLAEDRSWESVLNILMRKGIRLGTPP